MPPRATQRRATVQQQRRPTLTPKQIEEQKRRVRQTQACLRVQRIFRSIRVKKAMERVREVEDFLFAHREQPIVVLQEFIQMATKPSGLTPEEEELILVEASPPDFGIIIPELDTEEEKEQREKEQAEYDRKLAVARSEAEDARTAREELDSIDAAIAEGEKISARAFARELRRRQYQADATKAAAALFIVLNPFEGLVLSDFARLRAHKLRRIISDGPTRHLQIVLVRHGEADYLADKTLPEKKRPLTETGIMQAATAGQNMSIWNIRPDIILCSSSQRCLDTAQWIQELAPKEWLFSTCKALDQKEDPSGRLGPSIFPVADAIISAAEARRDIFSVCLVSHGMLLETIASCLSFQSDDARERGVNRLSCGDVLILQSKALNIAEGEDLTERSADDLWQEAMQSERWSVVEHMRGDGEPDPPTPRHVDHSTQQWYKDTTDQAWVAGAGDPLIYTDENLAYSNHFSGTKEPQASKITPGLRLLVAGYESPRGRRSNAMYGLEGEEGDEAGDGEEGEEGEDSLASMRKGSFRRSTRDRMGSANIDESGTNEVFSSRRQSLELASRRRSFEEEEEGEQQGVE